VTRLTGSPLPSSEDSSSTERSLPSMTSSSSLPPSRSLKLLTTSSPEILRTSFPKKFSKSPLSRSRLALVKEPDLKVSSSLVTPTDTLVSAGRLLRKFKEPLRELSPTPSSTWSPLERDIGETRSLTLTPFLKRSLVSPDQSESDSFPLPEEQASLLLPSPRRSSNSLVSKISTPHLKVAPELEAISSRLPTTLLPTPTDSSHPTSGASPRILNSPLKFTPNGSTLRLPRLLRSPKAEERERTDPTELTELTENPEVKESPKLLLPPLLKLNEEYDFHH